VEVFRVTHQEHGFVPFVNSRWLRSTLIGAIAALVPLTAFADFVNVSGSGVTVVTLDPGGEKFALDLGTVCAGSSKSAPVSLAIGARSHPDGTFFIFADGSTVALGASSSGGGLSATINAPGSIVLPGNWTSLPDGTLSSSLGSTVLLNASAAGPFSGTIIYSADGVQASGASLTKFSELAVTATIVDCRADVAVKKTAAASSIQAGQTASFSIVVSSLGPSSASNVVLTDTLPSGVTWTVSGADAVAAGCAGTVAGGGTLTCSVGTLAAGATRTVTVSGTTPASTCGELPNTAQVSASNDSDSGNNTSSATITVTCAPTAQFAPTQTTCQQFAAGTAGVENTFDYNLKNGAINNVSPGVVFYYTKVTAPVSGTFTVTVSQTDNGTTPPLGAAQLQLFTASCGTYQNFSGSTNAAGTSTFTINGATANQVFILAVKVDPHTVVGSPTPNPATETYTYITSVNGVAVPSSVQQAFLAP